MFSIRKKKSELVTVYAEELQAGDKFKYDSGMIEVLETTSGNDHISVRLGSNHPAHRCDTRRVRFQNDMICDVVRA